MAWTALQEQTLRDSAEKSAFWGHLIFYYAARRLWNKLDEIGGKIDPQHPSDAFLFDLVRLEHHPQRLDTLLAALSSQTDIWVYYSLAKYLLGKSRERDAAAVANASLVLDPSNTVVLNLLAIWLARNGRHDAALTLTDQILRVNPHQQDMVDLKQLCSEPGAEIRPPVLSVEPTPKPIPATFYLAVYNVEKYIRDAILGMLNQSYPLQELIIVDDGSTDHSIEIAADYPVRIIVHTENRGLAAARNTAFRHALTPYVGTVDTDAVAAPDFAKYAFMELENAPSSVAGVGGRLIELPSERAPDRWRAAVLVQDRGPQRLCPAELPGSNTVFRRGAVLHIGGYSEAYRTNAEDRYMARALLTRGYTTVYAPWAQASHRRRDTLSTVLRGAWELRYWTLFEQGVFTSMKTLLLATARVLEGALCSMMGGPVTDERIFYVNFLCPFYNALQDMRYACESNMLEPGTARLMQNEILETIRVLDDRFGASLLDRVRDDLRTLLVDAAADGAAIPDALIEPWNACISVFRDVLSSFDAALYRKVLEGPSDR